MMNYTSGGDWDLAQVLLGAAFVLCLVLAVYAVFAPAMGDPIGYGIASIGGLDPHAFGQMQGERLARLITGGGSD